MQRYEYILNCAIGSRNSEQSLRKTEQRFLRRRGAGAALIKSVVTAPNVGADTHDNNNYKYYNCRNVLEIDCHSNLITCTRLLYCLEQILFARRSMGTTLRRSGNRGARRSARAGTARAVLL